MKYFTLSLFLFIFNSSFGQSQNNVLSDQEKLFGLSTVWSEVKYNFANFDLTNIDWDSTYQSFIPKVLATNSDEEYFKELMKMMALIKDGHSNVYYTPIFSYKKPPFKTRLIEGKVIITNIYNDTLKIQNKLSVGDEILEIDRNNVFEYAKNFVSPYQSASTQQDLDTRTYNYNLLVGNPSKLVELKIKKADKTVFTTMVSRQLQSNFKKQTYDLNIVEGDIAHLKINDFTNNDYKELFDSIYPKILPTRGLIIDLRENGGGDDGQGNYVLSHMIEKNVKSSKSKTRQYIPTYKAWEQPETWIEFEPDVIKPIEGKEKYLKPLILLTSAQTYSAAEDFTVAFDNSNRGIKIGQTTGGSTGQPLFFGLPGGNFGRVCTKRDYFPDGKEFVGIGIKPDIEVLETIQSIIYKKDLTLEAAIKYMLSK